jgi:DNA-binding beta-propeller fold protein YncE
MKQMIKINNLDGAIFPHMQSCKAIPLEPHFGVLSEFLIADLAGLALSYLSVKEVLVDEWNVGDKNSWYPQRIALSPDEREIYVLSDRDGVSYPFNSLFQVFSTKGNPSDEEKKLLRQWETKANYNSLALSPSGDRFFTASGNRITIFSSIGKELHFWEIIKVEGDLRTCQIIDLAIGDDQLLYVCDYYNHRVQVFSLEGIFLRSWQLTTMHSLSLAIFKGEIFVLSYRDLSVYVYTPLGSLKRKFRLQVSIPGGFQYFPNIYLMTISEEGEIYVPNDSNREINVSALDGTFLRQIDNPQREIFRSHREIVISSQGEIYIVDTLDHCVYIFRKTYE